MFAGLSMSDGPAIPTFHPKEGEVVAIYSKRAGKFLEVSQHDGRLRATADKPTNRTALFRVMLLSRPMVDILVDSMATASSAKWARRRHWTGTPPGTPSSDVNGSAADPGCKVYAHARVSPRAAPADPARLRPRPVLFSARLPLSVPGTPMIMASVRTASDGSTRRSHHGAMSPTHAKPRTCAAASAERA